MITGKQLHTVTITYLFLAIHCHNEYAERVSTRKGKKTAHQDQE